MRNRFSALVSWMAVSMLSVLRPASALESTLPGADAAADGKLTIKQLPGGAVLHLAPGTHFELGRTLKLQLGPAGSPETVTQVVNLISGRVDVDLPLSKAPRTAVLIQGPHKVSAVAKGGHSIALVDANRVTFAAVVGDMLAACGNQWKSLPSGLVRSFVGHDPTYEQHPVPGIPSLTISRPLLLALDGAPNAHAQVGLVKDAARYEVGVWRVDETRTELVRRIESSGGQTELPVLAPGRYQVSAHAIDPSGIVGSDSPLQTVRVVGAELPPGARYQGGAILLGQRSRVKLLGAVGLEASYGASTHFVTAPDTVGLSRGEPTLLRLREAGTENEVRLGLEPRALRADIQITPKHPRWPEDTIEVSVRVFDARGRAVDASVQVKPTVLVDVEPVQVSWTRSNNVLHAGIPAPLSRGPWVVRVEIADEFGDPAGRDFMEVAGPTSERLSSR